MLQEPIVRKILGKVEIETILKKMEGKKLSQVERNYLYRSVRPKLIAAHILCQEEILHKINRDNREDESGILYNLSLYGFEMLALKKIKGKRMPLEELIVKILVKHPKPRFIEAIPIVLLKNRINTFRLLEIASAYHVKNKIGYLLETSLLLKKNHYFADLLEYLSETKDDEESFLVEGDEEFLRKTSPTRVKKWNLLGRFFDEDFKKIAKVYL